MPGQPVQERGLCLATTRVAEDQDLRTALQVLEQVELDRPVRLHRRWHEARAGECERVDDDVEGQHDREHREERAEEADEKPVLSDCRGRLRGQGGGAEHPSAFRNRLARAHRNYPRYWARLAFVIVSGFPSRSSWLWL